FSVARRAACGVQFRIPRKNSRRRRATENATFDAVPITDRMPRPLEETRALVDATRRERSSSSRSSCPTRMPRSGEATLTSPLQFAAFSVPSPVATFRGPGERKGHPGDLMTALDDATVTALDAALAASPDNDALRLVLVKAR